MIPTEFRMVIKQHLDKFAKKDAVFASKYDASEKSLDDCCTFIMDEAKKAAKKSEMIAVPDKVVFGWAIHFFDEKPAITGKEPAVKVLVSKEQKKEAFEKRQLSLFPDML